MDNKIRRLYKKHTISWGCSDDGNLCLGTNQSDGKILAIHPTAEEVKDWLGKLLSD